MNYGQKGGQNGSYEEPLGYISKAFQYFGLIFGMKEALMVLNACVNFGVQQKSGSRVRGQKGGQNGSSEEPFGYISKGCQYFWLNFGMKGALMVPNMSVNFGVQKKSGSRVRGQKGVKSGHLGSLSDFSRKVSPGFC